MVSQSGTFWCCCYYARIVTAVDNEDISYSTRANQQLRDVIKYTPRVKVHTGRRASIWVVLKCRSLIASVAGGHLTRAMAITGHRLGCSERKNSIRVRITFPLENRANECVVSGSSNQSNQIKFINIIS